MYHFTKILEGSHDEIYVCDGQGITLYCNKTFEENYGIKREDMLGKTAMYLVEEGYSNHTPIPEVIATKKKASSLQQTVTGKQLLITATPHFDNKGDIAYIIENCRDITELEVLKDALSEKTWNLQE